MKKLNCDRITTTIEREWLACLKSPCWRVSTAHQEGSGIQALGQAAAEAEAVSRAKSVGFRFKSPQSPGKHA
jgi:hypothetical protein